LSRRPAGADREEIVGKEKWGRIDFFFFCFFFFVFFCFFDFFFCSLKRAKPSTHFRAVADDREQQQQQWQHQRCEWQCLGFLGKNGELEIADNF
jgi:hypothetical protein